MIVLYYLNHYLQQWAYVHLLPLLVEQWIVWSPLQNTASYHVRPVETNSAQFTVGHHKKKYKFR